MRRLVAFLMSIGWVTSIMAYGSFGPEAQPYADINPNQTLLTSEDPKEKQAIVNQFTGTPGCYVLCLGPEGGLYPITNIYWLHGLIRISGHYLVDSPTAAIANRFCYPDNVGNSFSYFTYYQQICNATFPTCNQHCTGGTDTGGFFTNSPIAPQS